MFTGIVEEVGRIKRMPPAGRAGALEIAARTVLEGTKEGDSIAVNGTCLTVTKLLPASFCADVMPATLRRTALGGLAAGSHVNLERAMPADGRFGGHIVSGHIDGVGRVARAERDQNAVRLTISAPDDVMALIVDRGSIAIDGVSLTVAALGTTDFTVSIIPHTAEQTALLGKRAGDRVNLENDVVGKYVKALLTRGACPAPGLHGSGASERARPDPGGGITLETLARAGF